MGARISRGLVPVTAQSTRSVEGSYFCTNPECALRVPYQAGRDWAELPDGRLYSRSLSNGVFLCDACLIDPSRPVKLDIENLD